MSLGKSSNKSNNQSQQTSNSFNNSLNAASSNNINGSQSYYDPLMQQSILGNYQNAQGLGGMVQPYTGQLTAGFNPTQNSYFSNALNTANQGVGSGAINSATQGTQGLTGYNPSQISAQMLSQTNLQPYMNPYIQNVVDTTNQNLDYQNAIANQQANSNATQQNAFGGDRVAVANNLNNYTNQMAKAQADAGLFSQGYQNAQGAAQNDISNNLQGQLANQNAGLQGANFQLGANNQLGALGGQQQQNAFNSLGLQGSVGNQQQAQQQLGLTNQANQYQQNIGNQLSLQQIINQALGLGGNGMLNNSFGLGNSNSYGVSNGASTSQGTSSGSSSGSGFNVGFKPGA
jgi:hypothetical protein